MFNLFLVNLMVDKKSGTLRTIVSLVSMSGFSRLKLYPFLSRVSFMVVIVLRNRYCKVGDFFRHLKCFLDFLEVICAGV